MSLFVNETFDDFDDLAFDSPVVSGELLEQRFKYFLLKDLFVHLAHQIVIALNDSY